MPSWLIGAFVALVLGLCATAYFWMARRRQDETAAGLLALAALRWRDFSRLVLSSLQLRGLERQSFQPEDVRNQSPSLLLVDAQGKQVLLSCKHGTAYRIGSVAIDELASEARLRGAQRGILATEGVVDANGRDKAQHSGVEVLDGSHLWNQVKPLLDDAIVQQIVGQAKLQARRRIGLSWILVLLAGVLVSTLLANNGAELSDHSAPIDPQAAAAVTRSAEPASTASAISPEPEPPASGPALTLQHSEVSKALAKAAGLRQPAWISDSTLAVDMVADEATVMATVCAELVKHPDLTLTRIQLNPPPSGGDGRVHWRQCEATPLAKPASQP